ncbi:hypothetical protein IV38_GL001321 [Lactobacillus selangorensis]|uniref:DUF4828 domain-containing protein n=2 Tax=Lactobacillus selangorensis TaxID=81857 RepID=A0A0R2FTX8_9LACO|nr:hypothetical protein IV38_GL001321 [Lactobacillus selangorensis]KRN31825.1 hypothetical protein IV40_GL001108 [Lactobacillus selangorensis]
MGTIFGRHTAKAKRPAQDELAQAYVGIWHFVDGPTNKKHSLQILSNLSIKLDGQVLDGQIIGVTITTLTFLDHYGYQLKINADETGPYEIYDEAEDRSYQILKPPAPKTEPDDSKAAPQ